MGLRMGLGMGLGWGGTEDPHPPEFSGVPTFCVTSVLFCTPSSNRIWNTSCRNSSPAAMSRPGSSNGMLFPIPEGSAMAGEHRETLKCAGRDPGREGLAAGDRSGGSQDELLLEGVNPGIK